MKKVIKNVGQKETSDKLDDMPQSCPKPNQPSGPTGTRPAQDGALISPISSSQTGSASTEHEKPDSQHK